MKKASLEIAAEDAQTLQKILRCPTSESREILRAKTLGEGMLPLRFLIRTHALR